MSSRIIGLGGVEIQTDAKNNLFARGAGTEIDFGTVGGGFLVSGWQTAAVAAGLAASTMLASIRMATASPTDGFITRIRLVASPVAVGVTATIPGTLAWRKFTAQTPTGGAARTPCRKHAATGGATNLFDVRDSNAALTGSAPTFGDIAGASILPIMGLGSGFEWILDMDDFGGLPLRLDAGDGLALQTQSIMPATQTWVYSYNIHYFEK